LALRLAGRRPAVFLDYDGTLTPIVDRPEDAVISAGMRAAVRRLAARCPVCVVSGRDRPVVQRLMGIDDLIVAGSHGFDIWSPVGGAAQREAVPRDLELIGAVTSRLGELMKAVEGAAVEPKRLSVAAHYRMVPKARREEVRQIVETVLSEFPRRLKVTPGKMVYEVQPDIEWDKGRAVLHLLSTLDLEGDDVVPVYIGDDITDEHAFEVLTEGGIGVVVAGAGDDRGNRATAATHRLDGVDEVEQFLDRIATRLIAGRMPHA